MKGIKIEKSIEIKTLYTFFSKKYDKNYSFEGESHDFWELVCVVKGCVGITAGKYVYKLNSGECFFHRPMEFHRIWAEGNEKCEIIVMSFSCSNMIKVNHGKYVMTSDNIGTLKKLLAKSDEIYEKDDIVLININENKQYEVQIFVNNLENVIVDILSKGYSETTELKSQTADKYTYVTKIMEENINKRLSAEELADLCNMSVANLKKVFKKYSGIGVMEYFGDMKMKMAKKYLKEGKSVKETALLLGFYDQNYFNVFFKRHAGISPGRYR